MEKNVRTYKQHGMTCAVACMLMVLEYYKVIDKADYQYEKKYYRSYHSRYMDGTPFSAIAWHLAKNGFSVELFHSEKEIFKKDNSFIPNDMFNDLMVEYNQYLDYAIDKGLTIINGNDINSNVLKEKLNEDKLIILAGQQNMCLHAILLCGYDDDNFMVCDPLFKNKQIRTINDIETFMDTNIGKWFIAVRK